MYVRVIIKSKVGIGVWGTTSRCTYECSTTYENACIHQPILPNPINGWLGIDL